MRIQTCYISWILNSISHSAITVRTLQLWNEGLFHTGNLSCSPHSFFLKFFLAVQIVSCQSHQDCVKTFFFLSGTRPFLFIALSKLFFPNVNSTYPHTPTHTISPAMGGTIGGIVSWQRQSIWHLPYGSSMRCCHDLRFLKVSPKSASALLVPPCNSHTAYPTFAATSREPAGSDGLQESSPCSAQSSLESLELAANGGKTMRGRCEVPLDAVFPPFAPATREAPSSNGIWESQTLPVWSS